MTTTPQAGTTQVYKIYIKATPEAIWDAITKPDWTAQYGYTGLVEFDLRPGGAHTARPTPEFRAGAEAQGIEVPDAIIDGEVLEADPPRRLVHTFRMLMDPTMAAEPPTTISYDIVDLGNGSCALTLTHQLDGAPALAVLVSGGMEDQGAGGGHAWVLSDLKSLLETGKPLAG